MVGACLSVVGCDGGSAAPDTGFYDSRVPMTFSYPEGWSELSSKEWRSMDLGKNETLLTIMDGRRKAAFSIIPVGLDPQLEAMSLMLGEEGAARAAFFLESIDRAGPGRYGEYGLVRKGGTAFAAVPVGEIVYQGRSPGKGLRWWRVLVVVSSKSTDAMVMLLFSAPLGDEDLYERDFAFIESTWSWAG